MSRELPPHREPRLGRRISRQIPTVVTALVTLIYGAAMSWASLATPREATLPRMPSDAGVINDVPADLTWLLLIGIAIVAWRQIFLGLLTAVGSAALVVIIAVVEAQRYTAAGQTGTVLVLIYLIAAIQSGTFIIVGVATGLFGWQQRVNSRSAPTQP